METLENNLRVTGTEINYLYICKRKLWFFSHDITMEQNSVKVEIGKEIHDEQERTTRSEILIDNTIRVDYFDKDLAIHEIKLSNSMDKASRYQLLYYIYYLNKKGINCTKGIIHYPKTKRTETIEITKDDISKIELALYEILNIKQMPNPPQVPMEKKCKSCSYYELCFC